MTAERVLSQEELAALTNDAFDPGLAGLTARPLPAVLDTDCIRTGLHYQLSNGIPPRSVRTAQGGLLRLFMEYDTLVEAEQRLPRFADQLGVPVAELRKIINDDWLPHIDVVKLPASLRQVDPRALAVRDRDADDHPAAALAALLSPCLLLTRNYKHFGALGVRTRTQGVDGVMAVVSINIGEMQVQVAVTLPAMPVRVAAAGMKWATDRIGPAAWLILLALAGGGTYWYLRQPSERRQRISTVVGQLGNHLLDEYEKAAEGVHQARIQLRASVIPRPQVQSVESAILRELALSSESLSAQQLAELLSPPARSSVAQLRAFLRIHDNTVFRQVRRGGFVLGAHYELSG